VALTAKQEAFAQAIASGMNQSDAYRAAYDAANMKPNVVNVKASELMADGKVSVRVDELRRPVVEELQYGLKEAMLEAADAMAVARGKENGGAMVAAVTLRAKLAGLLIDKKEVRTGELDGLPHDELKQLREALIALGGGAAAGGTFAGSAGSVTH
jgi:hypothetical protein